MAKSTSPAKPKRVRRDRKDEILEKATALFGEYGFQGATLARIAEATGLTEPGVLHYFPSKVHLLQGVLEYHDRKEVERYSGMLQKEKKSVFEILKLHEGVLIEEQKTPGLIQLFVVLVGESVRSDHPSHDFFVERYRRVREMYVEQFLRMNQPRFRRDVNPEELTTLILAVVDGLQIQWLLDPQKVDVQAAFELFSKMVAGYMSE
ncbi:MAG: TetR/AcrR family transcriptional regulator [Anaerolineales bacterium]|jgi:AcrR family transcriptional regulator|nr:TetR/AcrR family transcriptional regulator [Anaerolineales bacterium]